jgi:hypothetical protein
VNLGWAYVFQLAENGSKFLMEQEIASPVGNNSYFGSGVGIYGDSIIVGADGYPCFGLTGAGFVFNKYAEGWVLNQSYPSPAGKEGHFGYAVDINANYSAIGAYGFGECVSLPGLYCGCKCAEQHLFCHRRAARLHLPRGPAPPPVHPSPGARARAHRCAHAQE